MPCTFSLQTGQNLHLSLARGIVANTSSEVHFSCKSPPWTSYTWISLVLGTSQHFFQRLCNSVGKAEIPSMLGRCFEQMDRITSQVNGCNKHHHLWSGLTVALLCLWLLQHKYIPTLIKLKKKKQAQNLSTKTRCYSTKIFLPKDRIRVQPSGRR